MVKYILIGVFILILVGICYFNEGKIYESQKFSPVNGELAKITTCIHDPYYNTGFIVSLRSKDELREIQMSLKNADKKYEFINYLGEYILINNKEKREQITKNCSFDFMNKIMKKNNTQSINYSV